MNIKTIDINKLRSKASFTEKYSYFVKELKDCDEAIKLEVLLLVANEEIFFPKNAGSSMALLAKIISLTDVKDLAFLTSQIYTNSDRARELFIKTCLTHQMIESREVFENYEKEFLKTNDANQEELFRPIQSPSLDITRNVFSPAFSVINNIHDR